MAEEPSFRSLRSDHDAQPVQARLGFAANELSFTSERGEPRKLRAAAASTTSHVCQDAAAKTLGVALGIDASLLNPDFVDNGMIKYVKGSLNGVG